MVADAGEPVDHSIPFKDNRRHGDEGKNIGGKKMERAIDLSTPSAIHFFAHHFFACAPRARITDCRRP